MPFHLHTHPTNRPPLQVQENHRIRATYANSTLPPRVILRMHHLCRLSQTRFARAEAIQQALQETQTRVRRLRTEDPLPWPDLSRQWQIEQLSYPNQTQQAYKTAHHTIGTSAPPSPPSPLPSSPTPTQLRNHRLALRRAEIRANPDYLAFDLFHHTRLTNLLLAKQELTDFRHTRRLRWMERAGARYRAWLKTREPIYHKNRHLVGKEIAWCCRMLGLRTPEEFDAHGWGVVLRRGTLQGRFGRGNWPDEGWFRMYKWQRYGRLGGQVPQPVGLGTAMGSGMWVCGGSPLKREVSVDEERWRRRRGVAVKRKFQEV